jgi:hypothetical protein
MQTPLSRWLVSGLIGAVVVTVLHEMLKRSVPNAPRLDTLGMRTISKLMLAGGQAPPSGPALLGAALGGDLAANASYYSLVGGAANPVLAGAALGAAAGLGSVFLPEHMGLGRQPTRRTPQTSVMTVALYTVGGLAAGAVENALRKRGDGPAS